MVGIFSRFSVGRIGHRRTQSAFDERGTLHPSSNRTNGIKVAKEFKPVEHPTEPLDYDQPIQCPFPDPSILNDGRIRKERMSASMRRREDLEILQDGMDEESDASVTKPSLTSQCNPNSLILPSLSASEHDFLNLQEEECKASGSV